jgi:phage baseplate assembly protein W
MNINPLTGKTIVDWEEYATRFKDAITTPLQHRLKRRPYGCKLYQLQGKPTSPLYISRAAAYIAECYYNPVCNLRQATLISITVGRHNTGFNISVSVDFNGVIKGINI